MNKADIDIKDESGKSPLHVVCWHLTIHYMLLIQLINRPV
jgi:hypothetical protein